MTERIVISQLEKVGQPGALFWQKSAVFLIAAPVFQVNGLMRNIKVAAKDQLTFAFAQLSAMQQKLVHEFQFDGQPFRAARA